MLRGKNTKNINWSLCLQNFVNITIIITFFAYIFFEIIKMCRVNTLSNYFQLSAEYFKDYYFNINISEILIIITFLLILLLPYFINNNREVKEKIQLIIKNKTEKYFFIFMSIIMLIYIFLIFVIRFVTLYGKYLNYLILKILIVGIIIAYIIYLIIYFSSSKYIDSKFNSFVSTISAFVIAIMISFEIYNIYITIFGIDNIKYEMFEASIDSNDINKYEKVLLIAKSNDKYIVVKAEEENGKYVFDVENKYFVYNIKNPIKYVDAKKK